MIMKLGINFNVESQLPNEIHVKDIIITLRWINYRETNLIYAEFMQYFYMYLNK